MTDRKTILAIVVILIALALIIYARRSKNDASSMSGDKKDDGDFKKQSLKTLVRQATRWSVASVQDKNPVIAVLHANYGAGYLWALKDIATDSEIEQATDIDVLKFRDEITKIQDDAMKKMYFSCPSIAPEPSYLRKLLM
jgi:hypothetical protein